MATLAMMLNHVQKLKKRLEPPLEQDTRLPYVYLNPDSGASWPGWEAHDAEMERIGRIRRIPTKYVSISPYADGWAQCSSCSKWFAVDPEAMPIYGIKCTHCEGIAAV